MLYLRVEVRRASSHVLNPLSFGREVCGSSPHHRIRGGLLYRHRYRGGDGCLRGPGVRDDRDHGRTGDTRGYAGVADQGSGYVCTRGALYQVRRGTDGGCGRG